MCTTLLSLLIPFVYILFRKDVIFTIIKNEMILAEKQITVLKEAFKERQFDKTLAELICTKLPKKIQETLNSR